MALFDKKKKEGEEIPIIKEQEEIKEALKKAQKSEKPGKIEEEFGLESYQFKEFAKGREEAETLKTFFEKACRFSGKYLNIGLSGRSSEKLNEALEAIEYKIEAKDVVSFSILVFLVCLIFTGVFILVAFQVSVAFMLIGLVLLFGIQQYPSYLQKLETMETMNMMPLAITYIVIYMRTSPTLEGAVRFTAKHLTGPLARDLRKLVWDLENGTYLSMDEALKIYSEKWREKNKNFSTAIEVIRSSQQIGSERERLRALDDAAKVILKGNLEIMKDFSRSLKMPILVLYMICIVLPVMGLVIAPILTTLMAQSLNINVLILIYNVALPVLVYFFLKIIMSNRPGAFSRPDIEGYPGLPSAGKLMIKTKEKEYQIPLLPLSILVFFVVALPGFTFIWNPPTPEYNLLNIIKSMTFIWAGAAAISLYSLGSSLQKLKVREEVEKLEEGFDVALYALSERLLMGEPIEHAVTLSAGTLKKGAVQELFLKISNNMKSLGMPFEKAIFDKKGGALIYYPSKLLQTIMEVIVESTNKGLRAAAVTMRTISGYLNNLRIVKQNIEALIGSTVTAMKFQAQFLTSFIAGIIIALDILLVRILAELGTKIEALEIPSDVSSVGVAGVFKNSMFNVASVVPAEYMQLIVGVYMIEVTFLLSILINGVKNGRDDINRNFIIGQNIIMSTVVYTIAMIVGVVMFASFKITTI